MIYRSLGNTSFTYDHILLNTRDPVRSPIYKQQRAELVLESVTIWESSVLYVLPFLLFLLDMVFRHEIFTYLNYNDLAL